MIGSHHDVTVFNGVFFLLFSFTVFPQGCQTTSPHGVQLAETKFVRRDSGVSPLQT